MIPLLNDNTIRAEVEESLNQLSINVFGNPYANSFTREQLIPELIGLYRAAVTGELDFVRLAIEEGHDLPQGYLLNQQTAVDERRRIVQLLQRLSWRAASTAELRVDDPSPVIV